MSGTRKIRPLEARPQGLTVVQAHGTFNIFHYGHLIYLQYARSLGDCLIVTVTAKKHVKRSGTTLITPDHQRVALLRALACVDDVRLIDAPGAEEAIRMVRPNVYVKGKEYIGRLQEQSLVESFGGKVAFHYDDEASFIKSTNLLGYLKEHADEPTGTD